MSTLLTLKAAKALIRSRVKAAGDWTYYANPENCLFGPHSGVGSWGHTHDWERVCSDHGIPFVRYSDDQNTPCAQVLTTAKALAERWARFTAHVLNWQPIPGSESYWGDNSATHEEIASNGARRTVTDRPASGDIC